MRIRTKKMNLESVDALERERERERERESYSLNNKGTTRKYYQHNLSTIGKASNRGITLVALVVTVVILLILAGITLTYVFGDNGIIKLAKQAKNETEAGMQKEQDEIQNLINMLKDEYGNSTGGGNNGGNGDNTTNPPDQPSPPEEEPTIVGVIDKIQDENTIVEDKNGNPITVPGGFKVVPNGGTGNVEYTYNGDGTPAVQDGIVIEDNEGNQFVWIPVGEIKNKDGSTTTITLGRYAFDTSNGTPTKQQDADNYTEVVTLNGYGGQYYQELTSDSGNTAAKNLGDFITKTKANGGYYFGRYEASKGSDNKVKSQYDKVAWTDITQPNAATAARGMYSSNYVESDLNNSYSWDTAIVFIQKYSGNTNYANKNGQEFSTSNWNTGRVGDKVCNIHDMASNYFEWSTEHSTFINGSRSTPCVTRGGYYDNIVSTTANRISQRTTTSYASLSFRPICYVK